jgi:hypothetical protein
MMLNYAQGQLYLYIYITIIKLCRQQVEVIQNHENANVGNTEQGEAMYRKYKRLKQTIHNLLYKAWTVKRPCTCCKYYKFWIVYTHTHTHTHTHKKPGCDVSYAFWISKNTAALDIAIEGHVVCKAHTLK